MLGQIWHGANNVWYGNVYTLAESACDKQNAQMH